jgi:Xaa-Pro aminopeptidase
MATDCTRTIVPAGKPDPEQTKNYTLVLKGLLSLMMTKFDEGILGNELDALARSALQKEGLNYAHGTGHGVGVNVHESGYSIRPESVTPMQEDLVGSIEPGCYIPGKAGIRLENIASVKREESGKLGFETLVYIGFWPDLIDRKLLTEQELSFLDQYEAQCEKRGRSFKAYALC